MQIFIYIFQFLLTSKCIFYYSTTADIFQCDFPVLIKHCFIWLFISILKIRYFGSKKQKYVNTLCHFYQWVLFLVYFVEFDRFYRWFTSELHKVAWKSNVKKVPFFILLNLANFIDVLRQNYISMNENQISKEFLCIFCWIWQFLSIFYVKIT